MRFWSFFISLTLVSVTVPAFAGFSSAPFFRSLCGERVSAAGRRDPLIEALQDPDGLRDRLFSDAAAHGYDLSQVEIAEARGQIEWMRDRLATRLSRRGWNPFNAAAFQSRQGALRHTLQFYDRILDKPQPSYADFVSAAGHYAAFYHAPSGTTQRYALSPQLPAVSLSRSDFPFPNLTSQSSEPVLALGAEALGVAVTPGPELSEYVLLPLSQKLIHDYVEGDNFLRLWSRRIYPMGLLERAVVVHDDREDAAGFAHHDLLHARLSYRAYLRTRYLATAPSVPAALRRWYAATSQKTEALMDRFLEVKNAIADAGLRTEVANMAWHLFHETRIPMNALDAYHLTSYAHHGMASGRLYWISPSPARAFDWHEDYWRSQLPADPQEREELLQAHEEWLLSENLIHRPGDVRYQIGAH